jgi:hypothetical protein
VRRHYGNSSEILADKWGKWSEKRRKDSLPPFKFTYVMPLTASRRNKLLPSFSSTVMSMFIFNNHDYSIHLSFVKNGPKKHNFIDLLPWFQKIGPNIPTRGICISNTTSGPSDNF